MIISITYPDEKGYKTACWHGIPSLYLDATGKKTALIHFTYSLYKGINLYPQLVISCVHANKKTIC